MKDWHWKPIVQLALGLGRRTRLRLDWFECCLDAERLQDAQDTFLITASHSSVQAKNFLATTPRGDRRAGAIFGPRRSWRAITGATHCATSKCCWVRERSRAAFSSGSRTRPASNSRIGIASGTTYLAHDHHLPERACGAHHRSAERPVTAFEQLLNARLVAQ